MRRLLVEVVQDELVPERVPLLCRLQVFFVSTRHDLDQHLDGLVPHALLVDIVLDTRHDVLFDLLR